MTTQSKNISEGLEYGEMQGLVSSVVSIDQYQPKIGADAETVVVALSVTYEKPAHDLSNFIETSPVDHLDVEVSPAPNEQGVYKVFVEFSRDRDLFKNIKSLLDHINKITSEEENWKFTAYKLDEPRPFDQERFNRDVISDPAAYRSKFEKTSEQAVRERIEFLLNY